MAKHVKSSTPDLWIHRHVTATQLFRKRFLRDDVPIQNVNSDGATWGLTGAGRRQLSKAWRSQRNPDAIAHSGAGFRAPVRLTFSWPAGISVTQPRMMPACMVAVMLTIHPTHAETRGKYGSARRRLIQARRWSRLIPFQSRATLSPRKVRPNPRGWPHWGGCVGRGANETRAIGGRGQAVEVSLPEVRFGSTTAIRARRRECCEPGTAQLRLNKQQAAACTAKRGSRTCLAVCPTTRPTRRANGSSRAAH
jgi:hypothetical protein